MEIYIIRHGETDFNKEGRLQGWTDIPLNQSGIDLAVLTGQAMKGIRFDAAFTSPLIRAIQTAEIVLRESGNTCDLVVDTRIKETHFGEWEGKKFRPRECEIKEEERCREFFTNPDYDYVHPGGESLRMVMKRTQEFIHELSKKDYQRVLVSTHGSAVRCLLNFLYDDPSDYWHGRFPYNCAVNILEADNGQIALVEEDKIYYDPKYIVNRYASVQK